HSVEEVRQIIGADRLIYQDLNDLIDSAREGNPNIERFDCSVFDGGYVTGGIDEAYLNKLENRRSDQAKKTSSRSNIEVMDDTSVDMTGVKEDA
ncbi:MAG: amidophosphoribosyltransferase, partial [Candidatus Saccharibacteria bacterium]|nr:amidophosphoribosyltransferase [Moraxellaceae bacterium]